MNRRYGPNKVMGNKQGQILRVFVIVVTAAPATDLTGGEAGRTKMIRRSSSGDTNVRHTEVQYGRRDERELRSWIGRSVLMSPQERFFLFFCIFLSFSLSRHEPADRRTKVLFGG